MSVMHEEPPKRKKKAKRHTALIILGCVVLAVLAFLGSFLSFRRFSPVDQSLSPPEPGSSIPPSPPTKGVPEPGEPQLPSSHGPHFNGWLEDRDVKDGEPQPAITSAADYYFTADVSAATYIGSSEDRHLPSSLVRIMEEAEKTGRERVHAYFRPLIIGRGLQFLNQTLSAEVWKEDKWMPPSQADEMVPFDLDLTKLRSERSSAAEIETWSKGARDTRLGGIRFPVQRTKENDCAAVLLSVWSESKMPIGRLIFPVTIGKAHCGGNRAKEDEEQGASLVRLLWERSDLSFDSALEIADYSFGHRTESVAIFVPREPSEGCASFAWKTPRAIGPILASDPFKRLLPEAIDHTPDDQNNSGYSHLARFLYDSIFRKNEPDDSPCGSRAAARSIQASLRDKDPRMFVRVLNLENSDVFIPLGVMFLAVDSDGSHLFAHVPRIEEPLVRETYGIDEEACLGEFAFSMPSQLKGWKVPIQANYPEGAEVLSDTKKLGEYMLRTRPAPDQGSLLLILGHHGGAQIFFSDPHDYWEGTDDNIARPFKAGSAAILDACSIGSVQSAGLNLIEQLNAHGFDVLIFSPFDVSTDFGAPFAQHFAEAITEARRQNRPDSIATLFRAAKAATLKGKTGRDLEDAEGDAASFVLAGNSSLHLCTSGGK